MLDTHLKKKQEAELLYRRAILIEPNHGYALYNLAVLLEERYSSALEEAELALRSSAFIADESPKLEILSLYQRASEADPKDDTTLADYGRYATKNRCSSEQQTPHTYLMLHPRQQIRLHANGQPWQGGILARDRTAAQSRLRSSAVPSVGDLSEVDQ